MDNTFPTGDAVVARDTAEEILDCLQQAHFAARRLEQFVPAERDQRLADRIHALRVAAHQALEAIRPASARPRRAAVPE